MSSPIRLSSLISHSPERVPGNSSGYGEREGVRYTRTSPQRHQTAEIRNFDKRNTHKYESSLEHEDSDEDNYYDGVRYTRRPSLVRFANEEDAVTPSTSMDATELRSAMKGGRNIWSSRSIDRDLPVLERNASSSVTGRTFSDNNQNRPQSRLSRTDTSMQHVIGMPILKGVLKSSRSRVLLPDEEGEALVQDDRELISRAYSGGDAFTRSRSGIDKANR
jgi:hypothetical protein